jgi:glycosyltransferase involved in cell wall biosynthesis
VIVQATEASDRDLLKGLGRNLVPVPFGASDWVDHRAFQDLQGPRDFDSVYVANYTAGKRIHVYLRALREIKRRNPDFRPMLVCAGFGDHRETIRALISHYGLSEWLVVKEAVSREKLNQIFNRCKCSVLLSLREGSNKAIFEGMFSGVPALLLRENVGANKDYITPETGMLTSDRTLADDLIHACRNHSQFRPRAWAMDNISPERTTQKLTETIAKLDGASHWGDGSIKVKVNSPEVNYFHQEPGVDRRTVAKAVLEMCSKSADGPVTGEALARIEALLRGQGN